MTQTKNGIPNLKSYGQQLLEEVEQTPLCKTLRTQGLAKCHPESCEACANYTAED